MIEIPKRLPAIHGLPRRGEINRPVLFVEGYKIHAGRIAQTHATVRDVRASRLVQYEERKSVRRVHLSADTPVFPHTPQGYADAVAYLIVRLKHRADSLQAHAADVVQAHLVTMSSLRSARAIASELRKARKRSK